MACSESGKYLACLYLNWSKKDIHDDFAEMRGPFCNRRFESTWMWMVTVYTEHCLIDSHGHETQEEGCSQAHWQDHVYRAPAARPQALQGELEERQDHQRTLREDTQVPPKTVQKLWKIYRGHTESVINTTRGEVEKKYEFPDETLSTLSSFSYTSRNRILWVPRTGPKWS